MSRAPAVALRLPFPFLLAVRYLRSARRDAFTSFLSAVTAGGIALGVAALILALAALSGFQKTLIGQVLARSPQIEVELAPESSPEQLGEDLGDTEGLQSLQLLLHGRGWLVHRSQLQAVELVGFAERLPAWFPAVTDRSRYGIYVSSSLQRRWGLERGDTLQVVSARPTLTPFGPQPRSRRVAIAGSFATSRVDGEKESVALPLDVAASLVGTADRRLDAALAPGVSPEEVARAWRIALGDRAEVRTGRDLNRPLFFALRLEKALIFVSVFLIVAVASLGLVAALSVILASKRSEIGILSAMGASPRQLRRAFLVLGGLLAGLGTGAGTVVGLAAAWTLDHFRVLSLPGQVYIVDYVPFVVRPGDLAAVLSATVVLTLVTSVSAARKATTRGPVEALRG